MKELIIKRCKKCGAMVEVLEDCTCEHCGIKCCGEKMEYVEPNSCECSKEKHLPQVEVVGNYVYVSVNHVMEADHHIEWIALACDEVSAKKFFKAGQVPKAVFPYIKGSTICAYCNQHGLWKVVVE